MSQNTIALIQAFEALQEAEKLDFANAILSRLPTVDSGALLDEEVAVAGDLMAEMLEQEEKGVAPR